ncbi:hypothetical protein GGP62_003114 [Salinibacter ruber]|uniref:PsbP-related protein n=1 Tax=Salinibacter ruber TaxID=146919 RepID=UPI002167356D|nr:PsbP-related protein [Salinibacter ruber]MCS3708111.1 hypothetical protein [Salinibacter ruber]MCS3854717.1 hypothetical protein [Salinibacter ruber]
MSKFAFLILSAVTLQALVFASPSTGQSELQTYQSEEFGYSIKYPDSHKPEKRDYPTQQFPNQERVRFSGPGVAYMVVVSQSEKLERVKNERLLSMMKSKRKMLERKLRRAPRDQVEVRSVTNTVVDGRDALLIEGKEIGRDIITLMALFKKDDRQFQVVARTASANWRKSREAILRVMKSLEVQ